MPVMHDFTARRPIIYLRTINQTAESIDYRYVDPTHHTTIVYELGDEHTLLRLTYDHPPTIDVDTILGISYRHAVSFAEEHNWGITQVNATESKLWGGGQKWQCVNVAVKERNRSNVVGEWTVDFVMVATSSALPKARHPASVAHHEIPTSPGGHKTKWERLLEDRVAQRAHEVEMRNRIDELQRRVECEAANERAHWRVYGRPFK